MKINPEEWVRTNKKRIAREILQNFTNIDNAPPVGIFTAGLPGSGKTEFTTELVSSLSVKPIRIDMDELAKEIDGYKPEIAASFRLGASNLLQEVYSKTIRSRVDFIFDGTLSQPRAIENIERAIKRGYTIKIYYIHQDPVVARKFTLDRELVERRGINRTGFIDTYEHIFSNLLLVQEMRLPITISVILKDESNHIIRVVENVTDIFEYLSSPLSRDELERVILE